MFQVTQLKAADKKPAFVAAEKPTIPDSLFIFVGSGFAIFDRARKLWQLGDLTNNF